MCQLLLAAKENSQLRLLTFKVIALKTGAAEAES